MNNSKDLVSVFTGSRMETNVIIEVLKDNNISVIANERFQEGLHAGFINGIPGDVELMVEREDQNKALALIEEYEASIN